MLRAAIYNAPYTLEFCRSVVIENPPIVIECRPLRNQPENECFPIVDAHVAANGGERVIGWAIWERPRAFIEAEFHAIWRSESGEYIDIVPRIFPFETITFLPDLNRVYAGLQVDNIRKQLIKDNDLLRYLFLFKRRFEILNSGDLAGQYGEITIPKKLSKEYVKLVKEIQGLQKRIDKKYPCDVNRQ